MDEPQRIQVILDYVRYCIETKDVKVTTFHHKFHPYRRKQSTVDLIGKAKEREIIFPPRIYCFYDAEVTLIEYRSIPLLDLYQEKKNDPDIYMVTALSGSYSLMFFKRGGKNLKLVMCTTPSYPALSSFDQIDITTYEKGCLPAMTSPENWDELDWRIYNERRDPRESSVKIGQKLGVTCQTVLTRYRNILEDCEIWLPFFPNGYSNYVPYVITLKTGSETAILSELKKLDRSSYVYKFDDTLILTLFFNRHLEIDSFLRLEKVGLIHDLRVSYPIRSHNKLWNSW